MHKFFASMYKFYANLHKIYASRDIIYLMHQVWLGLKAIWSNSGNARSDNEGGAKRQPNGQLRRGGLKTKQN